MLAARLNSGAIDSAELDARMLFGVVLGLDLTGLITAAQRTLTSDESTRLEDFTRRRLAGEPVARILGEREFWGLPLKLSPATLVPRPDTETVVELALVQGKVVLTPLPKAVSLETLLAGITTANLHHEVDFNGPVGSEAC